MTLQDLQQAGIQIVKFPPGQGLSDTQETYAINQNGAWRQATLQNLQQIGIDPAGLPIMHRNDPNTPGFFNSSIVGTIDQNGGIQNLYQSNLQRNAAMANPAVLGTANGYQGAPKSQGEGLPALQNTGAQGFLASQILEAAKNGQPVDPSILKVAQAGGDVQAAILAVYPQAKQAMATYSAQAMQIPNTQNQVPGYAYGNSVQNQQIDTSDPRVAQEQAYWKGRGYEITPEIALGNILRQGGQTTQQFITTPQGQGSTVGQAVQSSNVTGTNNAQAGGTGASTTGTTVKPGTQAAHDIINNSNLSDAQKKVFNDTVDLYPDSTVNTQAILDTFNKLKSDTIDPYYYNQIKNAQNYFSSGLTNLQLQREQELETERANAGTNIRQARNNLEQTGMTFSGQGIEQLGNQSAYSQGQNPQSAIPNQQAVGSNEALKGGMTYTAPFGGDQRYYEGTVNQANRLMATGNEARQQNALQTLGMQAQNQLGTSGAAGLGISYNTGGANIPGTINEQKQKAEANAIGQIYNNDQNKLALNTNINPF